MRPIRLSNRAIQTPPSPIRKLAYLANAARKSGLEVIPLNIGQPDIPSPDQLFEGLRLYKQKVLS
jgi:aspartate aminotransferase